MFSYGKPTFEVNNNEVGVNEIDDFEMFSMGEDLQTKGVGFYDQGHEVPKGADFYDYGEVPLGCSCCRWESRRNTCSWVLCDLLCPGVRDN